MSADREYEERIAWLKFAVEAARGKCERAKKHLAATESALNAALVERAPVHVGGIVRDRRGKIFRVTSIQKGWSPGNPNWKIAGAFIRKDGSDGKIFDIHRDWEVVSKTGKDWGRE